MNKHNISVYVPFTKSDDDQRMVYGYCTSESLDSQGEIILRDAIIKAWDKYMEYGNIREMHQASAVGVTKEYSHDDNGTWIGVKVVDDRAWKFVKEGVYKGFSIGGRVLKKNKNIIQEIILSEISLVDRPANPDAKFSVTKVDDGLVDQLQLEANKIIHYMKKGVIEIDGIKYKEDPNKPGEVLVDETSGEKVVLTPEEVAALDADGGEGDGADDGAGAGDGEGDDKGDGADDDKGGEGAGEGDGAGAGDDGAGAGEGADESEKAAKIESLKKSWTEKATSAGMLAKDSDGVLLLADLLAHLEFVMSCFSSDGKDVAALNSIKDALMTAIQGETSESDIEAGAKTKDLAKMFGSELSKAVAPLMEKMGTFEKSIDEIRKDVDAIKSTRVSPRPKGSVAIDKTIVKDASGAKDKTLAEKRKAVEDVEKEIDTFSKEWGEKVKLDPTLSTLFMSKSAELHGKLTKAKNELRGVESGE